MTTYRVPQWFRDGRPIKETYNQLTYVTTKKDVGKKIELRWVRVRVPRKIKKARKRAGWDLPPREAEGVIVDGSVNEIAYNYIETNFKI